MGCGWTAVDKAANWRPNAGLTILGTDKSITIPKLEETNLRVH